MKYSYVLTAAGVVATVQAQGIDCNDCGNIQNLGLTPCGLAWKAAIGACMAPPCNVRYDGVLDQCNTPAPTPPASAPETPAPVPTLSAGETPIGSVVDGVVSSIVSEASSVASDAASSASDAVSSITSSASSAVESAVSSVISSVSASLRLNGTVTTGSNGTATATKSSADATGTDASSTDSATGTESGANASATSDAGSAAAFMKPAGMILSAAVFAAGFFVL